jgi:hypothetical protein
MFGETGYFAMVPGIITRCAIGAILLPRDHNNKRDAFALPALLAEKVNADHGTRLGTAGLFTN